MEISNSAIEQVHAPEKLQTTYEAKRDYSMVATEAEQSSQSAMTSLFSISINTPSYGMFQFQAVFAHQTELFDQTNKSARVSLPSAKVSGVVKDLVSDVMAKLSLQNMQSLDEIDSDLCADVVLEDLKEELLDAADTAIVFRESVISFLEDCKAIGGSCQERARIMFSQAIAKRMRATPEIAASEHDINEAVVSQPINDEDEDRKHDEAVYETFQSNYPS